MLKFFLYLSSTIEKRPYITIAPKIADIIITLPIDISIDEKNKKSTVILAEFCKKNNTVVSKNIMPNNNLVFIYSPQFIEYFLCI